MTSSARRPRDPSDPKATRVPAMPNERAWLSHQGDIINAMVVRMASRRDFLDEIVDERTERNPEFPDLVQAALRRRQLLRELAARREKLGLSQTVVAARMGTSQSAVARLEAGEIDAKLSTVERFAAALGQKVEWRVAKAR